MSRELIKKERDLPEVLLELKSEIATCESIPQLKELKNRAKAWEVYYKASGFGLEAQNLGAELKIRAERRMGGLLPEMVKKGGDKRWHPKLQDETLDDLGITKTQSSRYQQLAKIPEEDFERFFVDLRASFQEITTSRLLRLLEKDFPETPPLPKGKYQVIYADPPWDIGSMVLEKWESPLEDKYPTMSEEKLKALDIQNISAGNSVCFMWATLTTLHQALHLLEVWGFKYHITLTWDKGGGWSANGFHRRTELVLVGYKGKLSDVIKQEGEYIPTIFTEKKTTHSTKPEILYKLIEERTIGNRIELFARNRREGWDVWGNEI